MVFAVRSRSSTNRSDRRGFTYVEILVTLTIIAILFVPMMQLFSQAMEATTGSRDLITAVSLARWEMERVRNLGSRMARVKAVGDATWPPLEEPPFSLNGETWRIDRHLKPDSEPLEITVEVRRDGVGQRPIVRLVTLMTDTAWGRERAPAP